ncbi:Toxin RTX-I translocation ATP-binding protein [bacterium HR39]|nr:Toxin RTX-I translocation ATP-binding protein [bacterium HR39]
MSDGDARLSGQETWETPQAAGERVRGMERGPGLPPGAAGEVEDDIALVPDPLRDALVLLAARLGTPVSPRRLVAGLPLEGGRLTPALAVRAAERAGLTARLARKALRRLPDLAPCIVFLTDGDARLLLGVEDGEVVFAHPELAGGVDRVPMSEFARRFGGWVLLARPRYEALAHEREMAEEREGHWFWAPFLGEWRAYGEVALAAVLVNLFMLASPLYVRIVYDRVVPNQAFETLWALTVGALVVFGFDFVLRILRAYVIDTVGRRVDVKLASRVFEHVLGMKLAHRPGAAGAFASHLREFESIRDFFSSATIVSVVDLPFVLMFIFVIWWIGGAVAIVPALAVPLVLGVGLAVQWPLDRAIRRTFREAALKQALLVEAVAGLETVKATSAEGRMQGLFERLVAATADSGNRARFWSAIAVNVTSLASNFVYVGVVALGVYEVAAGNLTVGGLVACSIVAGRAMAPLGQVAGVLARWHQARIAYRTIAGIMKVPQERPPAAPFVRRRSFAGAISFRDVTFTYPGREIPVLRGFSLEIRPGERVALVGPVGSGKTTVNRLVLGLYEPQEGAVLVDGTDVRQLDPADLRAAIGYVPQDIVLFRGTLRDNIALAAPEVDDAVVQWAAAVAGVHDFAAAGAQGYNMPVAERGETLSGGQRQAVAIARALLRRPRILLFDEPTSFMDTVAEERFKQRIRPFLEGRTLVLVTHRASVLDLVQRIVVVREGRVVLDGPRDEVLRRLSAGGQAAGGGA